MTPPVQRTSLIADVAALAQVSPMTVSRALNGRGPVSAPTRARVLQAAATLNYRPNVAAQTLSTGRSRTVGVVTLESSVNGPGSTLTGIEQEARGLGYAVSVAILSELTPADVAVSVESLRGLGVAGIILSAPHTEMADCRLPADTPMVAVEGFGGNVPVIAVDQRQGAVLATSHLIDAGHRRICHIAGPGDRYEALRREDGWRSTMQEAGLSAPEALRGDWTAASGYELGRQLADHPDATAVFVANDQMALGLLRALGELGVGVPGDVSIVGFDDIPEAAYLTPSLTTVRYNFSELGRRALRRLLEEVDSSTTAERRPPPKTLIEPSLVVRESSGAVPGNRKHGVRRVAVTRARTRSQAATVRRSKTGVPDC